MAIARRFALRGIALTFASLVSVSLLGAVPARAEEKGPLVLAAASLQEAMTDAANAWAAQRHPKPVISFAASSALARQVEAGAPADLFVSADEQWMDYIDKKGLLRPGTRAPFLSNQLVLIAPVSSRVRLAAGPNFPLARSLGNGRLALGDPAAVPGGIYAKQALTKLGVWDAVQGKVVGAESVRAALALVERGEAPLGIVYSTDARVSAKVRVVSAFPTGSVPPIMYPIATLRRSTNPEAEGFRRFLLSRAGKAIFARRGFVTR